MAAALRRDRRRARRRAVARIAALRDRLVDGLLARVDGRGRDRCRATARSPARRTCASTGVESEALLFLLDEAGVCAAAASACASGAMEPSHVLAAMGVDAIGALGALRLSLGCTTTDADVDRALEVVAAAASRSCGAC